MIWEQVITAWNAQVPWKDKIQVEQDLLLHAALQAIYADPELGLHLAFRGGTCLNKLYWDIPARYSEDLDFVQVHPGPIGPTIQRIRTALKAIFPEEPTRDQRKNGFRLFYSYTPEGMPGMRQNIKIEINTREHFAIEGYQKKAIQLNTAWRSGQSLVTTFSLEELLATKLRALYQRRKGRDLFDLWISREAKPDYGKVVAMFLEYLSRENKKMDRDQLIDNLRQKLDDSTFLLDIDRLIRPGISYDVKAASEFVIETLYRQIPLSKSKQKRRKKSEE